MFKRMKKMLAVIIVFTLLPLLPAAVSAAPAKEFHIKIVHTGDIHARVVENEKSGIIGHERTGGIIDSFTKGADLKLVLDSGDLFHGQPIATLVRGESIAKLTEACGYDAMTPGNHDFSYGKERLKELGAIAKTDILAGNIIDTETSKPFFDNEFFIKKTDIGGKELKVGIFGVTDPRIRKMTAPFNIEGLEFTDPVTYANKAAKKLKAEGCDIVIGLSHTYDAPSLIAKVSEVDLWLAGHEHKEANKTVPDSTGKQILYVESGYYSSCVSLIDISGMLNGDGEAVNLSFEATQKKYADAADYPKKAEVTSVLNEISASQAEKLKEKVGQTPVYLNGVWEDLRIFQQSCGNIVTDAYLAETGADVAFENAGGIRASVEKGDVTYGDIIGISPYGNYIVTKKISGKDLTDILEISFQIQSECIEANNAEEDIWPQSSGSYLQFGGMTVAYDPKRDEGKRVVSVLIGGKPLDADKMYTVATNNFVAESAYYPGIAKAPEEGQFTACDEALIRFFGQGEEKIRQSALNKRLFDVSGGGTYADLSALPEITVFSPKEETALFVIAQYNKNNALISLSPRFYALSEGLNRIDAAIDIAPRSASFKMFTWGGETRLDSLVGLTDPK